MWFATNTTGARTKRGKIEGMLDFQEAPFESDRQSCVDDQKIREDGKWKSEGVGCNFLPSYDGIHDLKQYRNPRVGEM